MARHPSERARTHGKSGTRDYWVWRAAKNRCYNPNSKDYPDYGGRGINMCDRWRNDFAAFMADMGPRPDGYSLERRDVNGPYSPENCEWIPLSAQRLTSRAIRWVESNGEKLPLKHYAEREGVDYRSLHKRVVDGGQDPHAAVAAMKARA